MFIFFTGTRLPQEGVPHPPWGRGCVWFLTKQNEKNGILNENIQIPQKKEEGCKDKDN